MRPPTGNTSPSYPVISGTNLPRKSNSKPNRQLTGRDRKQIRYITDPYTAARTGDQIEVIVTFEGSRNNPESWSLLQPQFIDCVGHKGQEGVCAMCEPIQERLRKSLRRIR